MPEAMDLEIGAPHMDIDLSILSAEEYRDARLLARRPSPARNELQHSKDDGSSSERRRRQRRAPSDDSIDTPVDKPSGKKQRGRPRLDPKDENAADRRRTQIRLAQRAYRLRKETTITTLRTRVTELENIIEGMQNTFFELHESSTECMRKLENRNERESFGETMRSLTERFIALVKAVEPGESLGEEGTTDGRSQGGRADEPRSRDDEAPSSGGSSGNVPMWGGYNLSYPKNNPHDESYNGSQNTSTPRNTYDGATQDQCTSSNIFEHQDIDFFSQLAPEPPSSMTYSFQNATFSRRLHRACLERAYSLLTSPSASQTEVERIFAYTLCYATRDEIVRSVQALLKAGVDQSLAIEDYPELPLHNVPDGTNEALARAKEGRKQLFKLGITGKFLKPTEIEQILVEKGVLETIDTSDSEHESSPASSHDYGYLPPVNASMDSATDVDTLFPSGSPNKAVGAEDIPRTKPIIEKSPLDLDLLVKELLHRGVCMGQYPGFKKTDVEDCIMIASRPQMVY